MLQSTLPAPTARPVPVPSPRASPTDDAALILPGPPSDAERDFYLGPQWRWVAPVSFLGYILIVVSIAFFVVQHIWAALLLLPLAVSAVGTVVSLFTSSRPRRDSLAGHRARVDGWRPEATPSVDVFLPSAGEDLVVLANTYEHVSRLHWPGELSVHVLDDSARPEVRACAEQYGFNYHSRPDRGHFKKAGNLRYGFAESDGDYILVLDADFVPRPDALLELAPYLDEPDVAIVQSPQYFDVSSDMNWLQRAAGATQILFYRWVQPSRDRSSAAICVGTSALYRREALTKSGGFALIGHSEDVHTGFNLMKVGYRIRYVPTIVTKGLCPDTLDQFLTQQYRWCTGSMSLLFSKGFHRAPLTFAQRACYWSGFLYYITTAVNVFVMALPAILMAWFDPAGVTAANYVFVLLAMVTRQTIVPFITLQSESMMSLARVQMTYSFSHAVALLDVLRRRTDSWVATGTKTRSRTATRVSLLIRTWCIGVQVLLWSAIVVHVGTYGLQRWWLLVVFTLLNLYLVYPMVRGQASTPVLADAGRVLRGAWSRRSLRPVRVEGAVAELETVEGVIR
ncbi:MAG: glycosyltransferase family 2 protein [Propionibacteriaceae bacterium]